MADSSSRSHVSDAAPAIALRGITKRFPGVTANDDIALDIHGGEIHVLLGENGAGKSTLIGILAGMQQPDEGEILVGGKPVRIASPRASLSLGEQQQVEIMRALWRGEKVLILDEPTSMLTPQGVKDLGAVMKRLRDKGVALILITHKLVEAYELGDRISVLRLGRLVGELAPERLKAMTERQATDAVIEMMFGTVAQHEKDAQILIGRCRQAHRQRNVDRTGAPRLQVRALTTEATRGARSLRGVDFDLWPG